MTQKIKSILSMSLFICLITITLSPIKAYGNEVTPRYNNVLNATLDTSVDNDGLLSIKYNYRGSSSVTTKAIITTYIEKQFLGIFWLRVDTGTSNDQWIQTSYDHVYSSTRTFNLSSGGTYRTTVIYEIYGTGGTADKITCTDTITY